MSNLWISPQPSHPSSNLSRTRSLQTGALLDSVDGTHCEEYGRPTSPVKRVPIYGRDEATEELVPGWATIPAAS
jgi:hypothetical protein